MAKWKFFTPYFQKWILHYQNMFFIFIFSKYLVLFLFWKDWSNSEMLQFYQILLLHEPTKVLLDLRVADGRKKNLLDIVPNVPSFHQKVIFFKWRQAEVCLMHYLWFYLSFIKQNQVSFRKIRKNQENWNLSYFDALG